MKRAPARKCSFVHPYGHPCAGNGGIDGLCPSHRNAAKALASKRQPERPTKQPKDTAFREAT